MEIGKLLSTCEDTTGQIDLDHYTLCIQDRLLELMIT